MPAPPHIQSSAFFTPGQLTDLVNGFSGPQAGRWQRENPLTATTIVVLPTTDTLLVKPAGTIAALTITLPTPFADGHYIGVLFTNITSALTYTNGTVFPAQAATTAGQTYGLKYDMTDNLWRVVT